MENKNKMIIEVNGICFFYNTIANKDINKILFVMVSQFHHSKKKSAFSTENRNIN